MNSHFRNIEELKHLFCHRSPAVCEHGRIAFSGNNSSDTDVVVTPDQVLLLPLLTVNFNFDKKLIDKTDTVKTLFKCCKQCHFYQMW